MSLLPEGVRRFFRLGRAHDVAAEVDDEIAFHLDAKARALEAAGMDPREAREEALRSFGDVAEARRNLIRTDMGDVARRSRVRWYGDWTADVRYAARALARTPGSTIAVIVMLGLGIGGAAAMYGLIDRLLLSVGPHVAEPAMLRRLYRREFDDWQTKSWVYRRGFSLPELQAIARELPATQALAGIIDWEARIGGPTQRQHQLALVTGNAFSVLGTQAALGRLLGPADDDAAAPPAVVISHAYWREAYGGDSAAVGRSLLIGRQPYTIVGVAPRGFSGLSPGRVDAWVPIAVGGDAQLRRGWQQSMHGFEGITRFRSTGDSSFLSLGAQRAWRAMDQSVTGGDTAAAMSFVSVLPYRRPGGGSDTVRLSFIVAGVAVILCLIATANVTNLLLLRAVTRRRETALRLALGSGRARLVRAVVLESTLLALGGALAACLVASWGQDLLRGLIVQQEWQPGVTSWRIAWLAGALGLFIGLVTGAIPGWQSSGPDAIASLRSGVWHGRMRSQLRTALLGAQSAFTVILLAGLGLYLRSFVRAAGVDYRVPARRLVTMEVDAPRDDSTVSALVMAQELLPRVRAVAGVAGVSLASGAPIYGYGFAGLRYGVLDSMVQPDQSGPFFSEIDSAFLGVTGLPVVRGRAFTGPDVATHATVALINEAFATKHWRGADPIGQCLYVGYGNQAGKDRCMEIVGVIGNYRNRLDESEWMQNFYLPVGTYTGSRMFRSSSLVVRSEGAAAPLVPPLLRLLREREPEA